MHILKDVRVYYTYLYRHVEESTFQGDMQGCIYSAANHCRYYGPCPLRWAGDGLELVGAAGVGLRHGKGSEGFQSLRRARQRELSTTTLASATGDGRCYRDTSSR